MDSLNWSHSKTLYVCIKIFSSYTRDFLYSYFIDHIHLQFGPDIQFIKLIRHNVKGYSSGSQPLLRGSQMLSLQVVSIGLFWVSFMPFSYNGVYYWPSKSNLSFEHSKWHFLTLTLYFCQIEQVKYSPAQRNIAFHLHCNLFD